MRLLLVLGLLLAGCGPKLQPMPSIHERCQGNPVCEYIGEQVEADEAQVQAPAYQPSGQVVIPPPSARQRQWVYVPPGGHVLIPPPSSRSGWVGVGP